MADLTGSERVHCLFRDPGTGVLWSLEEIADAPVPRPADHAGITTFAARTGAPVTAERAADSPLYRPELDDPDGDGSERLIAQPVFSGSAVIAVIAAVRPASAPPYSPAERLAVAAFAEHGGPILQHFLLDHRLRYHDEVAPPPDATPWAGAPAPAGVESHGEAAPQAVRLSQPWMQWSYQLLLAVVGAGLLFAAIARVPVYSAGPATVRIEGTDSELSAVALLPAGDRPRLAAGMAVGLELTGRPGKMRGVIDEVGSEVIGAPRGAWPARHRARDRRAGGHGTRPAHRAHRADARRARPGTRRAKRRAGGRRGQDRLAPAAGRAHPGRRLTCQRRPGERRRGGAGRRGCFDC